MTTRVQHLSASVLFLNIPLYSAQPVPVWMWCKEEKTELYGNTKMKMNKKGDKSGLFLHNIILFLDSHTSL